MIMLLLNHPQQAQKSVQSKVYLVETLDVQSLSLHVFRVLFLSFRVPARVQHYSE